MKLKLHHYICILLIVASIALAIYGRVKISNNKFDFASSEVILDISFGECSNSAGVNTSHTPPVKDNQIDLVAFEQFADNIFVGEVRGEPILRGQYAWREVKVSQVIKGDPNMVGKTARFLEEIVSSNPSAKPMLKQHGNAALLKTGSSYVFSAKRRELSPVRKPSEAEKNQFYAIPPTLLATVQTIYADRASIAQINFTELGTKGGIVPYQISQQKQFDAANTKSDFEKISQLRFEYLKLLSSKYKIDLTKLK